jgi:uncharacterized protein YndB with AHSA1/START domain
VLKKILIGLSVVIVGFVVLVATRPSDFRVTRSMTMAAPPEAVFAQVNDFHNWNAWSPWAKLDPTAKNSFEGPALGQGAGFRWDGNKDVGAGAMTILESVPSSLIRIKLEFLKPFKATDTAEFTFTPQDAGTLVTWSMYGKNNFMAKAVGLFMDCDTMVGGMFEKGLTNMKAIVENR